MTGLDDALIPRRAEAVVTEALGAFPVVVVNGPRQSGKSTLLGLLAGRRGGTLLTLDDRATLRAARTDPSGFVNGFPLPLYVDEVQRGGDPLVLAVKAEVDRHPSERGRYLLTGSSRFLTVPTLSESLAGRVRIVDLWPLSQGEMDGGADRFVDRIFDAPAALRDFQPPPLPRREAFERVAIGGFPAVQRLPSARLRGAWFEDYARTLVQRDILELRRIRQAADLPRLLRLVVARTAQELNVSALARAANLNEDTTRAYLALLETIYVHHALPAWSASFTARAKRRPKVHAVDSGLAVEILGLSVEALSVPTASMAGPLLESFVVGEIAKQRTWSDTRVDLYHFRDREGREVDLVIEARDGQVAAVEVKAARDVDEHDLRGLAYLRDRLGDRFVQGALLHLGERPTPFGDRLTALPVSAVWH